MLLLIALKKTGRPRIHANNADKQRAYREKKKLSAGILPPKQIHRVTVPGIGTTRAYNTRSTPIETEYGEALRVDTTNWGWQDWTDEYLGDTLHPHQVENLDLMWNPLIRRGILQDPRRYGKTTFVCKPFILRTLCESVFRTYDEPVFYTSHGRDNVERMVMDIREEMMSNEKLIKNYGFIIDTRKIRGMKFRKQTQSILNVINKREPHHSLFGVSMGSGIRGITAKKVLIDDPIDLEDEDNYVKDTEKFLKWLPKKVMPIARGGAIWLIGTKYNVNDIYKTLKDHGVWNITTRRAIEEILSYDVHNPGDRERRATDITVVNPDDWNLLAPELWTYGDATPLQNILYELVTMGDKEFQQEYQNDPVALNPDINWKWLQEYVYLPADNPKHMRWAVFVDTASGQTKSADYNAFVFGGFYTNRYYIVDIWYGRLTPLKKIKELEKFIIRNAADVGVDRTDVKALVEVVRDRDFYNLIVEDSWISPKPINPKGRGLKQSRIANNLGGELEVGRVFISRSCDTRKFKFEVQGFPHAKHEHIMDATDQLVYWLKKKGRSGGLSDFKPKAFGGLPTR